MVLVLVFMVSASLVTAAEDFNFLGEENTESAESDSNYYAGSSMESSSDRSPGDDKGAEEGKYLIETIRDDEGTPVKQNFWLEDKLIHVMAPESIDENSIKFSAGKDDKIELALYKDKKNNLLMANGFVTDIPPSANIVKKFKDGQNILVVWQDSSGNYHKTKIPLLSTRPDRAPENPESLDSEQLNDDQVKQLGLNGEPSDNNEDDKKSDDDKADDGNNTPDVNDSSEDDSSGDSTGPDYASANDGSTSSSEDGESTSGDSGNGSDAEEEPINVPPIAEPGNKYGVDAVMSDSEVESIVQAAIAEAKAAYKGEGTMNDWGVVEGRTATAQIQHTGGVDGFGSPVDYWLSQSSVRSKVDSSASKKRSGLEKEREGKIDKIKKERKEKQQQKKKALKEKAQKKKSSSTKTSTTKSSSASSATERPSQSSTTTKSSTPSKSTGSSNLDQHGAASSAGSGNSSGEEFE